MTATRKWMEQRKLLIEYPYLDSAQWRPLTCERFWQDPVEILVQMCLLVDLIHLHELVHCDLKLSNFLIRESADGPELVMVDLDFLAAAGSSPGAKVFGSPDHIAPEILVNDRVLAQTDNYSLGIAIRKCLEANEAAARESAPELILPLRELATSLTTDEPLHRPYALLDSLHRAHILDSARLDKANKMLFSMQLLPALKQIRTTGLRDRDSLRKLLTDPYKILGVCYGLMSDLADLYQKSPSSSIRIFRLLVQGSRLDRYGDFWRIATEDDQLKVVFDEIDASLDKYSEHGRPAGHSDTADVATRMRLAGQYREAGRRNRAFLYYRYVLEALESRGEKALDEKVTVLRALAELALELNRLEDAAGYYRELVDIGEARSQVELDDIRELESAYSDLGKYDEAYALAERGIAQSKARGDLYYELMFSRSRAWIEGIRGEYEKAEMTLQSVLAAAAKHGYHELEIRARYTNGITYWRRGLYAEAEEILTRGLDVAKEHNLYSKAVKVISALVMVCCELAEYEKAIQYGRLAAKHLPPDGGTNILPFLAVNMAAAHSRLADSKKADYWLMKSLGSGSGGDYRQQLIVFHNMDGNFKRNRGDYDGANVAFHRALDLFDMNSIPRAVAKIYHCLAEIAMFQGRDDICRQYLRLATDKIAEVRDETSQAELNLIGICNETYNRGEVLDQAGLKEAIKTLLRCNSGYFAVLGVFHLLLNAGADKQKTAVDLVKPLMRLLHESNVPLFQAVVLLIDLAESEETDRLAKMRTLKAVYRILVSGDEKYLALILCRRIAEFYRSYASHKLARKFYDQALKMAAGIRNERMAREIEHEIAHVSATSIQSSGMIESVLGISEVFKNIKNYRQSLEKVVKFAVDQTGAERGVLLLKKDQSNELRVAAFVNCDEDSLNDIRDFSSTIPLEVARSIDPLVIENALADKRTKNYKSIVIHNILSVICLPISVDGRVLGVLYLDHHTIPALFDKDDVTYVTSITNLMAVMILTIRSYRDITIINRQLVEDVSRIGNKQQFITQDASMLALFGKLPEIARTNATVLIVGESGTGKEILCEMIHKLSLRADKPLVKLNCAAIASTLIESELFGVGANVATDVKEREGRFSAADGGTLLLDEVGDMPLEVQAKVLRAVEYQQFEKVGSNKSMHTDIRFIYATNKDLADMVKDGEFRQDLFYRVNTISIEIPPLRERRADIPLLVEHFVTLFAAEGRAPRFTSSATETLLAYQWPGNVRELKNVVERCCILYPGGKVDNQQLPREIQDLPGDSGAQQQAVALNEKQRIRQALVKHDWNQSRASADTGIPLSTLRRKIRKYKITKTI